MRRVRLMIAFGRQEPGFGEREQHDLKVQCYTADFVAVVVAVAGADVVAGTQG